MQIINKMQIDLLGREIMPKIDAVQNDANSRGVEISLFADGTPWQIPEDTTAAVAYRKPDGTSGLYDKLPDGTEAITLAGSAVTAIFAPEMLTVPGTVRVSVIFNDENLNQLATFPFNVVVEENPAAGAVVSNNYYNYQTLGDINKALETINEALGKISLVVKIDTNTMTASSNALSIIAQADESFITALAEGNLLMFSNARMYSGEGNAIHADAVFCYFSDSTGNWIEYTIDENGNVRKGEIDPVLFSEQDLTEDQQAQARKNINAATIDDTKAGDDAWSSKNVANKLCPPFTESGAIVLCNPVEGYPLDAVTRIEPVQAGTGDPYPPGGGKNLFNMESVYRDGVNGGTSVFADGKLTVTGQMVNAPRIPVKPSTTYTISYKSTRTGEYGGGMLVRYYNLEGTLANATYSRANVLNGSFSFTTAADAETVILSFYGSNDATDTVNYAVFTEVQLEIGSTATAYAPYSNIRPITGHTTAKLHRCGKNIIPYPYAFPTRTSNGVTFTDNGDGSITVNGTATANAYHNLIPIGGIYLGPDYIRTNSAGTAVKNNYAFSLLNGTTGLELVYQANGVLFIQVIKNTTWENVTVWPQVEYGTAVTEYEPPRGQTLTVELGQTVYGGSLDWKTGVLTLDKAVLTLTGTEDWSVQESTTDHFQAKLPVGSIFGKNDGICSHYRVVGVVDLANLPQIRPDKDNKQLWYEDALGSYEDVEEFKALLAEQYAEGTPVQICYEMATPVTIQLTPQEIIALSGVNTLMSDTGDTTVTGREDPLVVIADQQATIKSILERVTALESAAINNT